jgi:hypothetical protein
MTGLERCKVISQYWKETTGKEVDPMDIWNYSPTGELFMVYAWYDEACVYYATTRNPDTECPVLESELKRITDFMRDVVGVNI